MLLELESAPSSACLRLIPLEIMQRYFLFPFSLNEEDHVLSVAFSDSDDFDLMADLQAITGCWIQPFQSTSERILEWIDAYCHTMTSTKASRVPDPCSRVTTNISRFDSKAAPSFFDSTFLFCPSHATNRLTKARPSDIVISFFNCVFIILYSYELFNIHKIEPLCKMNRKENVKSK
jgi:hypothetical protein